MQTDDSHKMRVASRVA